MSVTVAGMTFTTMPAGACHACGYPRWKFPVADSLICAKCEQPWTDESGQPLERVS